MTSFLSRLFRNQKPKAPRRIRILVVEGGGVRGVVTGNILGRLETALGRPLREVFDLMAGTSSGGISVMALSSGSIGHASELAEIFKTRSHDVFSAAPNPVRLPSVLRGSRYKSEGFEGVARDIFGDKWLSDCLIPTVVLSYMIERGELKLFGSINDAVDDDFKLVDVARATTAAPAFFPPVSVRSKLGETFWCVDGGVYANSPVLQAVGEAHRRFGRDVEIDLISVGPGDVKITVAAQVAQQWGGISWLKPAFDIHVNALSEQSHDFLRNHMSGVKLFRLAVDWESLPDSLRPTPALDDFRLVNLMRLNEGALRWLDSNDAHIKAARDMLL